ncbi:MULTISPECIES: hypothetical protein [Paenarthrobacter]|uniref:Lipoprotein n=1 Tax=Paenarthrobacter ureafaciens TaxID=37931 RepID=A0AAX3EQK8_PAEUR|nr:MULTISPECIES: hypothetical protein [Paenarthrobacter]MDO5867132.1 hypothetical protein [Paenarthrobacter sp. SD-2]MDO5878386.1 hypothetical protein [Paenarthrobacter sp. SD-1]UYV95572.1 hypothetical protein NL395_23395 [Paenarthrobacter ureafaciens]UYW00256.1 hypothetical protein NL394_24205 [Paenarthrobacter ureafaciens]
MNKKNAAVVLTTGTLVLALAGCWGGSPASDQQPTSPTPDPAVSCIVSCQDVPQAEHTGPPSLAADEAATKAATEAAQKVMAAYTDTTKSKEDWFQTLAPLITTGYAQDAQYIQPSRLKARKIITGASVVPAEVADGHQVRVKFGTNAGDWVVIMTRASAGAPWLASNVLPLEAS